LDSLRDLAKLVGRIFVAAIFLYDAALLARFPTTTVAYMEQFGVSGALLWPTALFELAGGLMIIAGLLTRLTAIGFSGFCVLTAILFHHDFADGDEVIQFGKDIGLAGGFLFLLVGGAGRWSLDARFGTDSWPIPLSQRRAPRG
jgi:putative oxidoreductase